MVFCLRNSFCHAFISNDRFGKIDPNGLNLYK